MPNADLVLGGGGVNGIAHVGAISVLAEHGYTFPRVAGSSAGAIAAAFVAARMKPERMRQLTRTGINYKAVPQETGWSRAGLLGKGVSLLFEWGVYDGDYLHNWLLTRLKEETGVETFGELAFEDPDSSLPPGQSYRLVGIVTDVSRGSLVRFPWDYPQYGLAAPEQQVAHAITASASIPFLFKPVRMRWGHPEENVSYLVDGGACSDFPIEIFDRTDGRLPRWPTFGVKLSARPQPGALRNRFSNVLEFAGSLLETVVNGNDQVHLYDPSVAARTIFVDTSDIPSTDFSITPEQQDELYQRGRAAAEAFLQTWDWQEYLATYGRDQGRLAKARAAQGSAQEPALF
jgi:NTE family protein